MAEPFSVLVVDDEESSREMMMEALRRSGYRLRSAGSAEAALQLLAKQPADLVVTDVQMDGMSGIELVREINARHPEVLVVVVTAFSNSGITIDAIRAGAFDFIPKPFQMDRLRQVVRNAAEKRALVRETKAVEPVETAKSSTNQLIGQSPQMIEVFKMIGRVANTESTVLIIGESGTGKELVARAIHENSYRRDKPFLALNCGALPETLLESELFGYEKGAFTGAEKTHMGIFEAVNGGTCLLDEIGEMPLSVQPKLLRVLQDGELRRVGSTREIHVDVRILASTNRRLETLVKEKEFREDLFYRLNVVYLEMPTLAQRREDIPLLMDHFLRRYMERNRRRGLAFSEECLGALTAYNWPGNVRELENVIESAATLSPTPVIGLDNLPPKIREGETQKVYLEREIPEAFGGQLLPLAEIERFYILKVLKEVRHNKSMAARVLGLDRKTLRLKLKQYGYEGDEEERR
jgi:two-component system response regulator AtoC